MNVLIACDLDSTLIYSRRSAGVDVSDLTCVEWRDGVPSAFMTAAAARTFAQLADEAVFVPVTTRTEAQLARVHLPGRVDYAIAANGGRILRAGVVDESWSRAVAGKLTAVASFAEACGRAERFATTHGGRPHEVEDLFAFAVLPTPHVPPDALEAEIGWAVRSGWRVSAQGRKVYWVPDGLTKSAAVAELARRGEVGIVLAAGDSLLDADLFGIADAGIRPAHGELATAGFSAPNVEVTTATGAAAGAQIVDWFAERVRSALGGEFARPAATTAAAQQ
jgi:hydroxymethylpyrimidine pyrophosphatase-like HAD family hydrolase